MRFSKHTREQLGHYVYGVVDPRNEEIFYVGMASANNRAFDHLKASREETAKARRIRDILKVKQQPKVEILRHGLPSKNAAAEVEAAVIDALGLERLTNIRRGHAADHGRRTAEDLELAYGYQSRPVHVSTIRDPCILFFVHRTYSFSSNEQQKYDSVRQFWSVSKATRTMNNHPLALGVVDAVVVRAYSIEAWFPAGTTFSSREWHLAPGAENSWEFVGQRLQHHSLLNALLVDDADQRIPAVQGGFRYLPVG